MKIKNVAIKNFRGYSDEINSDFEDLTAFVRHQIHHPENTYNARFNDSQLRRSIEDMRAFVTSKAQTSGTT